MKFRDNASSAPAMPFEEALQRVRADFLEMPGLRLTEAQARRLWALDPEVCSAVLAELVASRFLMHSRNESFVRADH
jgi:hypothetical protein